MENLRGFMQPLSKNFKGTYIEKTDYENSVHQFLYSYRNTPHSATKVPPAELMFSRKLRYTIPDISSKTGKKADEKAEHNDQRIQEKSKCYQDQTQRMQTSKIDIGTRVIVKKQKQNKLTAKFSQYPYVVTNVKESMITVFNKDTGHSITRNISFFKVITVTAKAPRARIAIEGERKGRRRISPITGASTNNSTTKRN